MPSLGGILSIANSALKAHQAAVAVAGQNIANAQTAGYTRQRLEFDEAPPDITPGGIFGTGVVMRNVTRTRDSLLDQEVRSQAAPASGNQTRSDLLGKISAVFGEPSDSGMASTLDAFWNAWSDLASNPASASAKTVVQQRGATLAGTFNRYSTQLSTLDANTRSSVGDVVSQVNRLATQVAAVNSQIVSAESGGKSANDARDERDRLIDQLSGLIPVTVIDRPDGGNQVMIGGMPLVDGADAKSLTIGAGVPMTVSITGNSDPLRRVGGKLGAILDVVNTDIPAAISSLDTLASSLIGEVNALHVTGWSPPSGGAGTWPPAAGPYGSGMPFFDPAPGNATARTIQLWGPIAADANAIAAGSVLNGPGNNSIALAVAGLRDFAASAPGNSFSGAYQTLVANVAGAKNAADDSASVFQALSDSATKRRQSAGGVSTDEELIALMSHQQAYVAASKLITTVDEMTQTLLDLKR